MVNAEAMIALASGAKAKFQVRIICIGFSAYGAFACICFAGRAGFAVFDCHFKVYPAGREPVFIDAHV